MSAQWLCTDDVFKLVKFTLSEKTKPKIPATNCSKKMTVKQMQNCRQEQTSFIIRLDRCSHILRATLKPHHMLCTGNIFPLLRTFNGYSFNIHLLFLMFYFSFHYSGWYFCGDLSMHPSVHPFFPF